jgi:hypothetical protein
MSGAHLTNAPRSENRQSVGAVSTDVRSAQATMCYLPGIETPERECWYINLGAVDKSVLYHRRNGARSQLLGEVSAASAIEATALSGVAPADSFLPYFCGEREGLKSDFTNHKKTTRSVVW